VSRELLRSRSGRIAVALVGLLTLAVIAAMAVLWPGGDGVVAPVTVGSTDRATVVAVDREACEQSQTAEPCQVLTIELRTGVDEGRRFPLTLPGTDAAPEVRKGDRLKVLANAPGVEAAPGDVEAYAFSDFERGRPVALLAIVFAVLVIVLGRVKGMLSLIGLGLSLIVVLQFIVPAILDGSPPLLVAIVGGMAVMLATLLLTHGVGPTSLAAALGAAGALIVIALLAVVMVEAAHLTGFSSEESTLLLSGQDGPTTLSLEGLVLAGIVIAALGVLDDVCVSQASTVVALRRADPAQSFRRLFGEAMRVGRDHLSATVNTLVFAYVGAALPILLIFETQRTTLGQAVGRESVAEELVGMLVGSIGLILAVPVTTALAAVLARVLPREALAADEHQHHHH
jgi:uncharacterized membrane protein